MRQYIEVILSSLLIWMSLPISTSWARTNQTYILPIEIRQKVDNYSKALDKLSDQIDETYFSVDALADRLDYDVQAAVEFVENEIAYDPYLGVMRGPEGTLSTEAGSSWDQAVLLAALINIMGGEAMLAIGELPDDEAAHLLSRGISNAAGPSDALAKMELDAFIDQEIKIDQIEPLSSTAISLEEYRATADTIAARIISQLGAASSPLAERNTKVALEYAQQIGSDYVWVHYRDTPNDPWRDVHPVYAGEVPPEVTAERYIDAQVPADKLHKVDIQFHIEVTTSDMAKRVAVSDVYSRPAANLSAKQLNLGISPDTYTPENKPSFFVPVIGNALAPGAKSFNMLGQILEPEDAAAGPAIFETVAGKLGGAIGEISEDGEKALPRLTGVILTVTQVLPGGTRIAQERRLTDFRDVRPENYENEMVSTASLEVNIGLENGARNLRDSIESSKIAIAQLAYFRGIMDDQIQPEDLVDHPAFKEMPSHGWQNALILENLLNPQTSSGRVVRTAPLIMMKRNVFTAENELFVVTDIQHARTRGFVIGPNGEPQSAPALALRQGVMDSLVEGEFIGVSIIRDWKTEDAMRFISDEKSLKADPLWGAASLLKKDRMLADLAMSGALMIPNNQQDNWWRVNVQTGEILAMSVYGGSEMTEAILMVVGLAVSGAFFTYGLITGLDACQKSGGGNLFQACCASGVVLVNGGLALSGIAAGAMVGWSGVTGLLSSVWFDITTGASFSPISIATGEAVMGACSITRD